MSNTPTPASFLAASQLRVAAGDEPKSWAEFARTHQPSRDQIRAILVRRFAPRPVNDLMIDRVIDAMLRNSAEWCRTS